MTDQPYYTVQIETAKGGTVANGGSDTPELATQIMVGVYQTAALYYGLPGLTRPPSNRWRITVRDHQNNLITWIGDQA